MSGPVLSLVVCTRDRASHLPPALASYARLEDDESVEIVFVDNASTDDTPRLLREFCAERPRRRVVVDEPRPGLGRARNTGLRAARGELVAYTDDDCYPRPDFGQAMLAAFASPALGFVAGRVLLFDVDDAPIGIRTSARPARYRAPHVFHPGEVHGANLAFRRSVLLAIGGFDELCGSGTPYPCEDVDAAMRASLAGFDGAYDPRPTVLHHHRRHTAEHVRAAKDQYRRGRGAYYAKFLSRPGHRLALLAGWFFGLTYWGLRGVPLEVRTGLGYLRDARRAGNGRG